MRLVPACSLLLLWEEKAASPGVFYPDRTGTPFTGGLLELDQKDASQNKPPYSTMPAKGACKCVSVSNQGCFKWMDDFKALQCHWLTFNERHAETSWSNPVSERSWPTFSELASVIWQHNERGDTVSRDHLHPQHCHARKVRDLIRDGRRCREE